MSHPSLRTAQGGVILLDVVSENISSWHGLCFVLHGHRFCRDIAVELIASFAIWIPDILLYFYRETGNWRFTGSEIRGIPYHWLRSNGSVSFTMSSGGQEEYSFIPLLNEEVEIFVWSSTSRHVSPRVRHISMRSGQPD